MLNNSGSAGNVPHGSATCQTWEKVDETLVHAQQLTGPGELVGGLAKHDTGLHVGKESFGNL
jgi:hypothetical protein